MNDFETVYSNDSLCIINVNITAKNGLGVDITKKEQYVNLRYKENVYEAFVELDEDSIFVSQASFEANKAKTLYKDTSYDAFLMDKVIRYLNASGRIIGNNTAVNIPLVCKTGSWELDYYNDEFGEKGSEPYLRIAGYGTFDNSATTGSNLTVYLYADPDNTFSLKFIEYNHSVVKDEGICSMKIKTKNGEIANFSWYNSESGQMTLSDFLHKGETEKFKKIIENEGEILCVATMGRYTESTYKFKINLDGYNKAISMIK